MSNGDKTGIAVYPSVREPEQMAINTSGPTLLNTVQALLDDTGDARMDLRDRDVAVAEATRFAEEILRAHLAHPRVADSGVVSAGTSPFPTGLLYGCVQSGKTRAITLTSAILFDNGVRLVVVLTSNNVELVEQTSNRLGMVADVQFITSLERDSERWDRDAGHIARYVERTGLLVVCQKERHHQRQLIDFLGAIGANSLPTVIFDDEADQATPDTTLSARSAGRPSAPQHGSTTYRLTIQNDRAQELGESLVETLAQCTFVQVTATPYALLLQHTEHPLRPQFTCLIEPGEAYMGGDWFFPITLLDGPAAPPIVEVPAEEANRLSAVAVQTVPEMLARSIAYFCLSSAAHALHTRARSRDGYSFLCHTSVKRTDHAHLERLISSFLEQVGQDLEREVAGDVTQAFSWADGELRKTGTRFLDGLTYSQLKQWVLAKLPLRAMRVINAESDTLSFTPGLNFFIGGNILGRGLTIKRLLVTYYMRASKTTQMDTMLQHARMFGYRQDIRELIRVFLPQTSIRRFVEIVRAERTLRALLRDGPAGAIPVRIVQNLNATRRNILDVGNLDAYDAGAQIYPHEPEHEASALGGLTERITALLKTKAFGGEIQERTPIEISWEFYEELITSIRLRTSDESRWLGSALVNVAHSIRRPSDGTPAAPPILWVRQTKRSGPTFENGVAGGDDPSRADPEYAERLVLMMFLHSGDTTLGLSGSPFWYPTVLLPSRLGTFLFSASE